MLCSYVEWSKRRLGAGQLLIKLIGYTWPKDIIPAKVVIRERRINIPGQRLLVCTRVFVHKSRHMRLKVYFINMCVLHVGPKMARHIPTLRLNVTRVQTTTRPENDLGFKSSTGLNLPLHLPCRRRDHITYSQVLADKSDSGHKVVHGNNCVYHKAPVVDLVAPK